PRLSSRSFCILLRIDPIDLSQLSLAAGFPTGHQGHGGSRKRDHGDEPQASYQPFEPRREPSLFLGSLALGLRQRARPFKFLLSAGFESLGLSSSGFFAFA